MARLVQTGYVIAIESFVLIMCRLHECIFSFGYEARFPRARSRSPVRVHVAQECSLTIALRSLSAAEFVGPPVSGKWPQLTYPLAFTTKP